MAIGKNKRLTKGKKGGKKKSLTPCQEKTGSTLKPQPLSIVDLSVKHALQKLPVQELQQN